MCASISSYSSSSSLHCFCTARSMGPTFVSLATPILFHVTVRPWDGELSKSVPDVRIRREDHARRCVSYYVLQNTRHNGCNNWRCE